MSTEATYYTITDARFLPGTIAMINSLRLTGHAGALVVLDVGLRTDQAAHLSRFARLVPFDRSLARNPTLFKPFARLTEPSGVAVLIDSDQIVTGSLQPIIEAAKRGRICAFPDPEVNRWFSEWSDLFGLQSPLRREPYVNAGLLALSVDHWPHLLDRWWELCTSIWDVPTIYEQEGDSPASQGDQDALNAILMSEVPGGAVELIDPAAAPAAGALAEGVDVIDVQTLRCRYQGTETLLLHSAGQAKPWIREDWPFLRRTAYVRLLRRLLAGRDLAIKPLRRDLAPWLRPGPAGETTMMMLNAVLSPAWRIGDLPVVHTFARRVLRLLSGRR